MELITIIGVHSMDFTGNDGRAVAGIRLFYTYQAPNVEGLACDKVFLSVDAVEKLAYVPMLGETVKAYYNRYGKISSFERYAA